MSPDQLAQLAQIYGMDPSMVGMAPQIAAAPGVSMGAGGEMMSVPQSSSDPLAMGQQQLADQIQAIKVHNAMNQAGASHAPAPVEKQPDPTASFAPSMATDAGSLAGQHMANQVEQAGIMNANRKAGDAVRASVTLGDGTPNKGYVEDLTKNWDTMSREGQAKLAGLMPGYLPPVKPAATDTKSPDATDTRQSGAAAGGGAIGMPPPRMMASGGGGLSKAMRSWLDEKDASDVRRQAILEGPKNAAMEASDSIGNAGFGIVAGNQGAIDRVEHLSSLQVAHAKEATEHFNNFLAAQEKRMGELKGVDPDRWWNTKSTGGKVMSAIGLALGAFGAAMPHSGAAGRNYAQELIQNAIDNDIKAQKVNLDHEWSKITKGTELAKDKLARSQWESDRFDKEKHEAYEKAKLQAQGYMAMASSDQDKAKIQAEVIAPLSMKQEELAQAGKDRRFQALQQAAAAAGAGGGGALQKAEGLYELSMKKWIDGGREGPAPSRAEIYGPYMTGLSGGGRSAQGGGQDPVSLVPKTQQDNALKEQAQWAKAEKGKANIGKLFSDYDKAGVTDRRQIGVYQSQIGAAVKRAAGEGMSSDNDFEVFIKPNLPAFGDNAKDLAVKQQAIQSAIDSSYATPVLDRHARGWRGAPQGPAGPPTPGATPRGGR